jgi:hypothetical protein
VGQHPRCLTRLTDPQRGHFEKTVFVEDALHPGKHQPTRYEFNQDVGWNVVRCQHRFGTAIGVGGDDLQRAIAETISEFTPGLLHLCARKKAPRGTIQPKGPSELR